MGTLKGDCSSGYGVETETEVIIAENAGFCSGVKRAFDIAVSAAKKHGKAYTIGELVHNNDALRLLREHNVFAANEKEITDVADIPEGGIAAVIRSHGVPKDIYDKLKSNPSLSELYDATCPFVKKIHNIAEKADVPVIIAGDKSHPEVEGIAGHVKGDRYIVNSPDELKALLNFDKNLRHNSLILVAQTTFNVYKWRDCIKFIKKHCTNAKIFDTICNATVERQTAAEELSREVAAAGGVMLVIGGKHSSNSVKLYEICKNNCGNTYFIENSRDLPQITKSAKTAVTVSKIGITAGASVPAEIIKEVHSVMNKEINGFGEPMTESELDFMAEVDKTFRKIHTGKRVKAYVMSVNNNEVVVDLGVKQSGYIPADEIGEAPVNIGDEIECIVTKVNDAEGFVYLSKKKIDTEHDFEKLETAYVSGEILEGRVEEVVNGGLIVSYNDQRIFVPASHSSVPKGGDLETMNKKTVKFKIIEINQQRKRLVGSIKAAGRFESNAAREKFWSEIEVGKRFTGEIKSMESYGVFVDLGGVDGMVHRTELTWAMVKHPKEVVSVGDKLDVVVKSYDPEKKRISLTAKNPEDNPWTKFTEEYSVGMTVTATIVSITPFGAFAQIIPGIDGLIHISQISDKRVNHVKEVLKIGQEVNAQITEIDPDKTRVSLSIRALIEPQAKPEEEQADEVEQTDEQSETVEPVEITETVSEVTEEAVEEVVEEVIEENSEEISEPEVSAEEKSEPDEPTETTE